MRIYADEPTSKIAKLEVPVVDEVPEYGMFEEGELLFCRGKGLHVFDQGFWMLITTQAPVRNNLTEEFEIREGGIQKFTLRHKYKMNCDSINVYIDGRKLQRQAYVEISENEVILKDPAPKESIVEFQIFNIID